MPETRRLLKARSVAVGHGPRVAFNFDDLRKECDEYVQNVNRQVREHLVEAKAQAEALRQQAFAEGRASGRQAGLAEAQQLIETRAAEIAAQRMAEQSKTTLPALKAAVTAMIVERDRWLAWWESAAVRLCVTIAEKIIRHELERKPEIATPMISEALQLAAGSPNIKVRLHPRDIEQLGKCSAELNDALSSLGEAALTPDQRITPGGCYIETTHGVIDARLETQLTRIAAELLDGNSIVDDMAIPHAHGD